MAKVAAVTELALGYDPAQPILSQVSFALTKGESLALVGPNGAGKSTLLNVLRGTMKPLTGQLDYSLNPRRDIAYLPQASKVDRSFPVNVRQFVSTGLWNQLGLWRGFRRSHRLQVNAVLEKLNIADLADSMLDQLSGGQFQRVLFARTMLQQSKLLLLDEPFNGVDEATVSLLLDELASLQRRGCTVVAAIHDLEIVRSHFERCLLLSGEAIALGPSREVLVAENIAKVWGETSSHLKLVPTEEEPASRYA
ncbi:metal ABC transporter ATP-binding protein [Aliagarivorans marinus]|uniref:metal ABC transporter ATP-binding protein n=1 Tax=Aliagarivorans marinus TaxID=561965 RepID=UPI0003F66369|nr:ABC transporter ATP-binding protein [Aliagarivorans marinus]